MSLGLIMKSRGFRTLRTRKNRKKKEEKAKNTRKTTIERRIAYSLWELKEEIDQEIRWNEVSQNFHALRDGFTGNDSSFQTLTLGKKGLGLRTTQKKSHEF